MPNWCMNTLYLTHSDPEQIERAEEALGRRGFMNEFLPTPPDVDSYTWHIEKWGTKWDVEASTLEHILDGIRVTYESAWAPPIMFYQHLLELDFEVRALYFEPGVKFCGIFEDGEDTFYSLSDLNSEQVKDLITSELESEFGILGYFSESEEEESEEEESDEEESEEEEEESDEESEGKESEEEKKD